MIGQIVQQKMMQIARDKEGTLRLFDNIPVKHEEGYWTSQRGYNDIELDSRLFPGVTWENSPKKVDLVEEDLVEKACKWLDDNLYTTYDMFNNTGVDSVDGYTVEKLIEEFKKAMKNV